MIVWNDNLDAPISCAYAYQSFETFCNIYAGDYPVVPFCTEGEERYTEHCPMIHAKPWLFPDVDSVWTYRVRREEDDEVLDLYMHPVWRANDGTELCRDRTFTLGECSLRICSSYIDGKGLPEIYGIYTLDCIGNMLDLQNYAFLRFDVYSPCGMKAKLQVYQSESVKEIDSASLGEIDIGWERIEFNLEEIGEGAISRIALVFENPHSRYKSVNIENFELVPKEYGK